MGPEKNYKKENTSKGVYACIKLAVVILIAGTIGWGLGYFLSNRFTMVVQGSRVYRLDRRSGDMWYISSRGVARRVIIAEEARRRELGGGFTVDPLWSDKRLRTEILAADALGKPEHVPQDIWDRYVRDLEELVRKRGIDRAGEGEWTGPGNKQ